MQTKRLRLVIFQDAPGLWLARALEHDLSAEARTIGEGVRALLRLVEAHTAFDLRHAHAPLSAFTPAPQAYWNAYASGMEVSLAQLGVATSSEWDVHVAFASRRPWEDRRLQDSRRPMRAIA